MFNFRQVPYYMLFYKNRAIHKENLIHLFNIFPLSPFAMKTLDKGNAPLENLNLYITFKIYIQPLSFLQLLHFS